MTFLGWTSLSEVFFYLQYFQCHIFRSWPSSCPMSLATPWTLSPVVPQSVRRLRRQLPQILSTNLALRRTNSGRLLCSSFAPTLKVKFHVVKTSFPMWLTWLWATSPWPWRQSFTRQPRYGDGNKTVCYSEGTVFSSFVLLNQWWGSVSVRANSDPSFKKILSPGTDLAKIYRSGSRK